MSDYQTKDSSEIQNNPDLLKKVREYMRLMILGSDDKKIPFLIFNSIILGCLLVNVFSLSLNYFPEFNENRILAIDMINIVSTVIFICEMIIKISALGFKEYFFDKYNIIDFVVVNLTSIEIFYIKIWAHGII